MASMTSPRPNAGFPPRIVLIPAIISAIYAWAVFVTSFFAHGAIGPDYDTPGTDYMVFHAGVAMALHHDLALLFDANRFTADLNSRYHALLPFPLVLRPWVYPPGFLVLLLPFAPFGFLASYLLFQAVTAGLLAGAITARSALRRSGRLALAALTSPAASVNLLWGQAAFLTSGVLIGGFRLLPARPLLAGALLGVLSVKPQHALLVPVALIALRAWPAIMAAFATTILLALLSSVLFGAGIWLDWLRAVQHYATVNQVWDSSLHTCLVLLNAGSALATAMEIAAILGSAIVVYLVFRGRYSATIRLAILLAASNLAAPHTGPYDTLMLVLAAGLVLSDSTTPQPLLAWTLGLCIWMLPLIGQPALSPSARFAPLLTITLIGWLISQQQARDDDHAGANAFAGPRVL